MQPLWLTFILSPKAHLHISSLPFNLLPAVITDNNVTFKDGIQWNLICQPEHQHSEQEEG